MYSEADIVIVHWPALLTYRLFARWASQSGSTALSYLCISVSLSTISVAQSAITATCTNIDTFTSTPFRSHSLTALALNHIRLLS